jgi:peptide/nickel transport system substrate-binding protein
MKWSRLIFIFAFLLGACSSPTGLPTPQLSPKPVATATQAAPEPTIVPSPTAVPERTLVVCLSEEPQSLYLYGGSSRSQWNVLEALYDGPFDTRGYSVQPVILDGLPSLADGSAVLQAVSVAKDSLVVDTNGALIALQVGASVFPAGCNSLDCAVKWDGKSALQMDQLSVKFKLKTGIRWSDGTDLSAQDSVFSYNLAADAATPTSKTITDRTASYQASDAQNLTWMGVPGFVEQRYPTYFFTPLPKHLLDGKSAAQILADESARRNPLGWGPYILENWTTGDHITFKKNPAYFRAAEGLPKFDHLVYRFLGNPADSAKLALVSGECDLVDQNPGFQPELESLINNQNNGKLKLLVMQGPEWEHLDFGIRPASYDDGFDPTKERPDLFGDVRTRKAVASCIDRTSLVQRFFFNRSSVPGGYQPPNSPQFQKELIPLAYSPDAAAKLLDAVGWKLSAGAGSPRVATGVKNVPDGTKLAATLYTSNAALRQQVAAAIADTLKGCGVQVNVKFLDPGSLYAPGPDGQLFGRNFDMAEFFWEAGARPACAAYLSGQIPSAQNQWIGANVTGWSSAAFDAACNAALWARPDQPDYAARIQAAEKAYADELPSVPLFFQIHLAIARPDMCGVELDPTARSLVWNLEQLDYGKDCK